MIAVFPDVQCVEKVGTEGPGVVVFSTLDREQLEDYILVYTTTYKETRYSLNTH